MSDYINRKDLIDALNNNIRKSDMPFEWCQGMANAGYIIMHQPSAQLEPKWIPVKMRPMDSQEREYWEDQFGEKLEDEDAVMFDCPMPEDRQEILVSYRKWISMDKCEIDGGCYGLEGNGDWEDVIAWMPLPEPYKGGEEDG